MSHGIGDLLLRINEADYSEPMQFTGLHDKNGQEIYEGDVVDDMNHLTTMKGNRFGVIKYIVSGYGITYKTHTASIINPERTVTVVGNVYENPELLA